jgi:hypothetical protein
MNVESFSFKTSPNGTFSIKLHFFGLNVPNKNKAGVDRGLYHVLISTNLIYNLQTNIKSINTNYFRLHYKFVKKYFT